MCGDAWKPEGECESVCYNSILDPVLIDYFDTDMLHWEDFRPAYVGEGASAWEAFTECAACVCKAHEGDEAVCRLNSFRGDGMPFAMRRPTSFTSYDDLKSFLLTIENIRVKGEDDSAEKLQANIQSNELFLWGDFKKRENPFMPYEGAYETQLAAKRVCDEQFCYIDALLYDLYSAVFMIETYGAARLRSAIKDGRLDSCSCQDAMKCPDGTSSPMGSTNIYDCEKTGSEVLVRKCLYRPLITMSISILDV